jgi:anaerobic ribonucleoside-triphosphate reductase
MRQLRRIRNSPTHWKQWITLYFNSIGGTALEVGSVKVNTVNLARLAYENKQEQDYLNAVKDKVVLCLKALDCVRDIIIRDVEKGLLPNYSLEIMNMKSQYNTIGIIGIYEALQKFGYTYKDKFGYTFYSEQGIEFAKSILKTINDTKTEFASGKEYMINVEQIPGERAASVLMQKDMFFYPDEKYELPLYGNQWSPLGIKTTLNEKIRLSAILDQACNGGSIAHFNIDAPFNNFDTAWRLLNHIADEGVQYFAFNLRISACKNNHGFYGETCPVCGEAVFTTYQRIVGFLVPEKTYSKERKAEFKMRDWMDLNAMNEI